MLNPWQHRPHKQDFYDNHDTLQQQHHQQQQEQQQQPNISLTENDTTSLEDFFQGHKQVFYQSQMLLQHLQQRQRQQKTQEHGPEEQRKGPADEEAQVEGDDDGETDSQRTAWSRLGIDSPMNQSSSTLADADTPVTTVIYMTDSDFGDGDEVKSAINNTWALIPGNQEGYPRKEERGFLYVISDHSRHIV